MPVLLLRSPSEDSTKSASDKYEDAFRKRSYHAISVPVLETVYVNAEELAEVVGTKGRSQGHEGEETYAGVIITSNRACEAWNAVVKKLTDGDSLTQGNPLGGWTNIPFYTVGQATASALATVQSSFPASPYVPHDIRGGAESGTSEKLAHLIVADLSTSHASRESGEGRKKLLYLTGDKNRDTLPTILEDAGLQLDRLQVYATQGSSRFEDDLKVALCTVEPPSENRDDELWWIVHFAPSSAKHVFPILSRYFSMPHHQDSKDAAGRTLRLAQIAAIGPTTSSFLESELGVHVDVVAAKPSPDSLVESIVSWDRDHGSWGRGHIS